MTAPGQSSVTVIADADRAFTESLRKQSEASQHRPCVVDSVEGMERVLATESVTGVFINPTTVSPLGAPLISLVLKHQPGLPVFYILDPHHPDPDREQLEYFMVQGVLRKPLTYSHLLNLVAPRLLKFDQAEALRVAEKNTDKLGIETSGLDLQFIPIRASSFISGNISYFDLYVRLGANRYVKILQAKESFSPERLTNYLKKGLTHFHIRREAQEHFLRYCENLASGVLKSKRASTEVKTALTLNYGQEVMSFFKSTGVSETGVEFASRFAEDSAELISQLDTSQTSVINDFLKNIAHAEHGVSTSMVAAMLLAPLGIKNDKSVHVVGVASVLHDIGLNGMPPKFVEEDESMMTEDERKLFWTHPTVGAEMLRKVPNIEPVVIQAVEQHHERRDRKGFPNRLGSTQINRVSEIIGISEEFVGTLNGIKKKGVGDPLVYMQASFQGYTPEVVEAFRSVFANALKVKKTAT